MAFLLPHSGTPMNITTLGIPISSIPYMAQLTSTSPIVDQLPTDTQRKIYIVEIYNEDPSLTESEVWIFWNVSR